MVSAWDCCGWRSKKNGLNERRGSTDFRFRNWHPSMLAVSPQERIDVRISQEQMLGGKQHTENGIRVYSVLYDGVLTVTEPDKFRDTLQSGIGHGKVMGLGLLSVAPIA